MLRTALLGGNSITLDADMSKYIETVSDQGVIEGLEVSSGSVAPGKAWVKATRSNGETIMVLVQNTEALSVDTSGTKKIWLEIKQEAIDNGALNNEDGTGIASIKTGPTLPSQNSLLLASVNNGRVEDARAMIPKIQSVAQRTGVLEQKMETQEQKVERLEEAGLPEYIGKKLVVEESYQEGEEMIERQGKLYHRYIAFRHAYQNESWYGVSKNIGQYDLKDCSKIVIEIDSLGLSGNEMFSVVVGERYFASFNDYENNSDKAYFISPPIYRGAYKKNIILDKKINGVVFVTFLRGSRGGEKLSGKINILGVREDNTTNLLPRSIVGKGGEVECTLQGIHSNGQFYNGYSQKKLIGKILSGRSTSKWTATSGGILVYEATYSTFNTGTIKINGVNIAQGGAIHVNIGYTSGQIYVPQGDVLLEIDSSGGFHRTLNLLSFIPL